MSRKKILSIINHLVGILLYIIFLGYFGTSVAALILNFPVLRVQGFVLNLLLLMFEMIGPIYIVYFMMQLFDGVIQPKKLSYQLGGHGPKPKVAVLIPVRNAHPKLVREVLEGATKQQYTNFEVWLGDDNSEQKYAKIYQKLAEDYQINYYYGEKRGFKAGILNQLMRNIDAKYIAFFDVDQIPEPGIIEKFVAVLEQHPEYAFVQAKFDFHHVNNLLHSWEIISYYQLACAEGGKMLTNSVIFHGCNACFQKEYAYPLPEGKLSEDFEHSINLMIKGAKGCWVDEVGVLTLTCDTFDHKMSQMFRWTTGQVGAVMDHWKDFLNRKKLSWRQATDLFISSTLTMVLSSLFFIGIFYALLYGLKIPIFRALVLGDISMIIIPLLIGIVYCFLITITAVYSIKKSRVKVTFFQIMVFLLFSAFLAPILLVPTIKGLFRKNKLIPGKSRWNKKPRLYLISSICSFFGLIFLGLGIISILDNFNVLSWYPDGNFFYTIFFLIAFMLLFSLPFVAFGKWRYKHSTYFQEEQVFI